MEILKLAIKTKSVTKRLVVIAKVNVSNGHIGVFLNGAELSLNSENLINY